MSKKNATRRYRLAQGRVFISEILRFEDLGSTRHIAEDSYKVLFRNAEIGEFDI
jgi:hypothetical protein